MINPPEIPVNNAEKGLIIAKGNPIKEKVARMESTPVCGVEIRNETVPPFDAPFLKNAVPVGITPQEHNGKGIPKIDANTDDLNGLPLK